MLRLPKTGRCLQWSRPESMGHFPTCWTLPRAVKPSQAGAIPHWHMPPTPDVSFKEWAASPESVPSSAEVGWESRDTHCTNLAPSDPAKIAVGAHVAGDFYHHCPQWWGEWSLALDPAPSELGSVHLGWDHVGDSFPSAALLHGQAAAAASHQQGRTDG